MGLSNRFGGNGDACGVNVCGLYTVHRAGNLSGDVARVRHPRNQRFDRRNTIQIAWTVSLKFHALIVPRFKAPFGALKVSVTNSIVGFCFLNLGRRLDSKPFLVRNIKRFLKGIKVDLLGSRITP